MKINLKTNENNYGSLSKLLCNVLLQIKVVVAVLVLALARRVAKAGGGEDKLFLCQS